MTTHPDAFGVRRAVRIVASQRGCKAAHAERVALRHLASRGDRTDAIFAGLAALPSLAEDDIA